MCGYESWTKKKTECRSINVLTLEVPMDSKEIQPVHPKGNQSWIFIRKTDAEVETPVLWPPDIKSWLTGEDSDAGKDWRRGEKGMTEDEIVGWHHSLDGHQFEQALGVGAWQGSLVCCSPWGSKDLDTAEQLNSKEKKQWRKVKAHTSPNCANQHPGLNSPRKSLINSNLESHLGQGPGQCVHPMGETSNYSFQGSHLQSWATNISSICTQKCSPGSFLNFYNAVYLVSHKILLDLGLECGDAGQTLRGSRIPDPLPFF